MNQRGGERIVFVDKDGNPTGEVGPKLESHHDKTRLHLAFSCYVFNPKGKVLITQRALGKKVWPGVWTNSFCGHPMPGESMKAAIVRRAQFELGIEVSDITCILPKYHYKTPPYKGIIENEFCPVFVARTESKVQANPKEVAHYYWVSWTDYVIQIEEEPQRFSYWATDQYMQLNSSPLFNSFLASLPGVPHK